MDPDDPSQPSLEDTAGGDGERSTMAYGCWKGGVIVWEHANFSGRSTVFCEGWYPDLRDYRKNLNFWESWNDRITSVMVFGSTSTRKIAANFWRDIKYYLPFTQGTYVIHGNNGDENVGSWYNDTFSSLKVGVLSSIK